MGEGVSSPAWLEEADQLAGGRPGVWQGKGPDARWLDIPLRKLIPCQDGGESFVFGSSRLGDQLPLKGSVNQ